MTRPFALILPDGVRAYVKVRCTCGHWSDEQIHSTGMALSPQPHDCPTGHGVMSVEAFWEEGGAQAA